MKKRRDRWDLLFLWCRRVVLVCGPLGALLLVWGWNEPDGAAGGVGAGLLVVAGIALAPFVIVVAAILLVAAAGAAFLLFVWGGEHARRGTVLRLLGELDARIAAGEDEPLALLDRLEEAGVKGEASVQVRFLDERMPEAVRRRMLRWVDARALEEVALRPKDPVGPWAWHVRLQGRYDEDRGRGERLIRVRGEVDRGELRALWERAVSSPAPWALPAEIEVHEERG